MDAEISKTAQKILTKQGIKFKLNTKVLSGDDSGEGVKLEVEAAKGGKQETVSVAVSLLVRILLLISSKARCGCRSRSYRSSALHCWSGIREHWPRSR